MKFMDLHPKIKSLILKCIKSGKFKDRQERLDFASDFFGYTITSFAELSEEESDKLLAFLEGKTVFPNYEHFAKFDKTNKQHNYILSLAHQLGWVSDDNPRLVDLQRLGGWIQSKRSPVRRPLKEQKVYELRKIIVAMESMILKKQVTE